MVKIRKPQGADRIIVEEGGAIRIMPGGVISIGEKSPVNAEASAVTLAAADLAVMGAGDVVSFVGANFTKAAVPGPNEWDDAAALAALINALPDWTAAEAAGAVTVTAATRGAAYNDNVATLTILEDTTAGGAAGTKAAATIAAATITQLANGDTVGFAGQVFKKAAATSVQDNEFADQAGLIQCIDALDDWTAVDDSGAIDIEAANNGEEYNDFTVMVSLRRVTIGGVDGTIGQAGDMYFDQSWLYIASQDNSISDNNWRRIPLGNVYP